MEIWWSKKMPGTVFVFRVLSTGCYGIDNFSKFKAENKFGHRHTCSIPRTKFISPTRKLEKLAFCSSLSTKDCAGFTVYYVYRPWVYFSLI